MKTAVKFFLSLLIAIVAAVASVWFPGADRFDSFVVGLLFFIISVLILELVAATRNLDRLRNQYEAMLGCLQGFLDGGGSFGKFFNLTVIEQLSTMVASNEIVIQKEPLYSFWLKMIAHCENSLKATSYVDPKTWESGYIGLGLDLQASRCKQGVNIRRVFILKTSDEMDAVLSFIESQRKVAIDARYIMEEDIDSHSSLDKSSLDSLDFIIVDDGFLAVNTLNEKRIVQNMKLTANREELAKYELFYDQLFLEARAPKCSN